ncbi:MAG TPA: signal peptidase I [Jatrophihabitans sp.]|jgi:signal peptidase
MTVLEIVAAPAVVPRGRRTLRGLGVALAIVTGLAALAGVVLLLVLPLLTGATPRTVLTGSMGSALPPGSLAFDRPVDPGALRVGDIATYREPDGHLVTHRIVGIDNGAFEFRGDANPVPDPLPVRSDQIVGRVWFDVPGLGTARNRLLDLRPLLLWLGVAGLATYSVVQIRASLRERRDRP